MGRHDEYLIDAETQTEMDAEVESHEGEQHPKQPLPTPHPDAGQEEREEEHFGQVLKRMAVMLEDGTRTQHIAEQMVAVELYRLAQEIVDDGGRARGGGVGPFQESRVGHRHPVFLFFHPGLFHFCLLARTEAVLLQLGGLGFGCLLFAQCQGAVLHYLAGQHKSLVLISGKAPDGYRGHQHGEEQVGGAEEALAADEEGREEYLDAVAQRGACQKGEQQPGESVAIAQRLFLHAAG